jgi:hypothetical protein
MVKNMRRDGSFIKIQRLKEIQKQIVSGFPNEVDYHRIILWTEMNVGLTTEKAEEYVNKLIEANGWFLIDGKIKAEA